MEQTNIPPNDQYDKRTSKVNLLHYPSTPQAMVLVDTFEDLLRLANDIFPYSSIDSLA